MSDMTYFRVGVPNDMVADVLWNEDFEVSMEPRILKPETNYQRYFGTPETALEWMYDRIDCNNCPAASYECYRPNRRLCREIIREWLESEVSDAD